MNEIKLIRSLFPERFRFLWRDAELEKYQLQEIRIRVNQPVILLTNKGERFFDTEGRIVEHYHDKKELFIMKGEDFSQLFNYLCRESVYAYMEEMKRGYLSVRGGHRVGIAGELFSVQETGLVVRNVRYLNIRIAREKLGVANLVLPFLFEQGKYQNTLLISPPGCGKTTLLRDIIRQLSDGNQFVQGRKIGVVDERYELLGSSMEEEGNHLGMRTDVLSGCLKKTGMMMLLRAMSPEIIAVDEIGSKEDEEALVEALRCGCGLIATMHGNSTYDEEMKIKLRQYMQQNIFKRYIFLGKDGTPGKINGIFTEQGACLKNEQSLR